VRSSTAVKALLAGVAIAVVTAVQPVFAASGTTPASDPTLPPTVSTGPSSVAPTAPTDGPTTSAPATAEPTATTTPTAPPTSDSPPTGTPTETGPPPRPVTGVPAPVPPATVNPAVTIDPVATRNCRDAAGTRLSTKLALAQSAYDAALLAYQARLALRQVGTIGDLELAPALIELAQATIALNNAKFELAACQTKGGGDPKKDCTALLLELNRVAALIAQRQLVVDATKLQYDLTQVKVNAGSLPASAMGPVLRAWNDAKTWLADAQQDEQDVHAAMNAVAERCGFMRWPDPPANR
jgi:hypothetical protein